MKLLKSSFTQELEKFVKEGLKTHTLGVVGFYDSEPYQAINAYSDDDELMGTIVFRYYWGSIQCKYLYISPSYRQQSVGTQLLKAMEDLALEKSCEAIYIDTLSFQAVEYYKKLGFQLEFIRDNYKHDVKHYYFKKIINH